MKKETSRLFLMPLLALITFNIFCFLVFADAQDTVLEKKKAAIIKIMKQGTFEVKMQQNEKFCAAFLEDFKEQKGIEHIMPIVEADDYNDPKLQAYLKLCPKLQFNKTYELRHTTGMQEIAAKEKKGKKLTDKDWEEAGAIDYYATKNFKLYKVNIDNNAENGDEYVFYAEGYKNIANNYTYGGYTIVDLKKCERDGGANTIDPYDYIKKKPIENYNGIIKYQGEYYIFKLEDFIGRYLELSKYDKNRKKINRICSYNLEK